MTNADIILMADILIEGYAVGAIHESVEAVRHH